MKNQLLVVVVSFLAGVLCANLAISWRQGVLGGAESGGESVEGVGVGQGAALKDRWERGPGDRDGDVYSILLDERDKEGNGDLSVDFIKREYPELYKDVLSEQLSGLLYPLFSKLVHVDVEGAMGIWERQGDGEFRDYMLDKLVEDGKYVEPLAVFDWLRSQSGEIGESDYQYYFAEVIGEVAKVYPEYAEEHLSGLSDPYERDAIFGPMAEAWWGRGREAAFAWLETLDGREAVSKAALQNAYERVMTFCAREEPSEAAEIFRELDDERLRWMLTVPIIDGLARTGVGDALAWVLKEVEDPKALERGLSHLTNIAHFEPDIALNLITGHPAILEGGAVDALLSSAIANSISSDPTLIFSRLDDFPANMQPTVVSRMASEWFESDREAAQEWLSAQPAGLTYDIAAKEFAHLSYRDDPELALAFAQAISSANHRKEALSYILSVAPEDQLRYIQSQMDFSSFDSQDREALLRLVENRQYTPVLVIP